MSDKSIFSLTGDFSEIPLGEGDTMVTIASLSTVVGTFRLTSISSMEAVDYQIQKTLEQNHTVSSFGDSAVLIQVAGLQIFKKSSCPAQSNQGDVVKWYRRAKLSAATRELLSVNIGGNIYKGYVVKLNCNPTSGESVKTMVYTLTIIANRTEI